VFYLLTTGEFILPTHYIFVSLWSSILLRSMIAGNFLLLADWMHSTSRILLCKPRKLYQSVFAKSSATLVRKSIPNFSYILNQKFIYQALRKYAKFFENIPILKFSNLV